jgi:FtsZ-binding cell division protein ZapB
MKGGIEMSVWLGNGCLKIGEVSYFYGEVIPTDKLDPNRVKELEGMGLIGELPKLTKPVDSDVLKKHVELLEAENERLLSANNGASIELAKLKDQNESLIKENEKLQKSKKWSKK